MIELLKQPYAGTLMPKSHITLEGETKALSEWLEQYGTGYSTYKARVHMGWPKDKAIKAPNQSHRMITHNGITLPFGEWAKRLGISRQTLYYRIANWGLDRALRTKK